MSALTEAEAVAQVKAERIGPAAQWGDDVPLTPAEQDVVHRRLQDDDGEAAAPSAEDQTGVPDPANSGDGDGDENGADVIVEADDDQVAAWVADHTVDQILETLATLEDDDRAFVAERVRDAETARGDDTRSTLLAALDKVADDEEAQP